MLRGFIGPLGDDIPSIFPIVAGMLLFIGTILYANAQIDTRNVELRQREGTQQLAYLATQKGTFQPGEFKSICDNSLRPFAENNALKFAVVVKRFCEKGCPSCGTGIDLQNSNLFHENENPASGPPSAEPNENYVCTNTKQEYRDTYIASRLDATSAPKNVVALIYPFTVPCPDETSPNNGLATVNVIVWR